MYKKVLVPLDGSELAECVLPHVEAIAKGCQIANVVFVRVIEPVTLPIGDAEYFSSDLWTQIESQEKAIATKYLKQLVSKIKYNGINVESKILSGRVADSLVDYASNNKVDLIIIATHGRSGISRWVRGSVADRILVSARIPVLIVTPPKQ